jgi:hypothetical protein
MWQQNRMSSNCITRRRMSIVSYFIFRVFWQRLSVVEVLVDAFRMNIRQ